MPQINNNFIKQQVRYIHDQIPSPIKVTNRKKVTVNCYHDYSEIFFDTKGKEIVTAITFNPQKESKDNNGEDNDDNKLLESTRLNECDALLRYSKNHNYNNYSKLVQLDLFTDSSKNKTSLLSTEHMNIKLVESFLSQSSIVILAWGNVGKKWKLFTENEREKLAELITINSKKMYCFKINSAGEPGHPAASTTNKIRKLKKEELTKLLTIIKGN